MEASVRYQREGGGGGQEGDGIVRQIADGELRIRSRAGRGRGSRRIATEADKRNEGVEINSKQKA